MAQNEQASALLTGLDDLLIPFHEAIKPPEQFLVGTEAEKPGLLAESLEPLPFEGPRSVSAVLALLAERYGWHPEREHETAPVIALTRNKASITLEPGGQLELSGAPLRTIHETHAELAEHFDELRAISGELGIVWMSLGFHPFATQAELPHVPKLRYGVMEKYLPTRGPRSLDMMRRTCTVQANLDYESEDDAMRKLRVSLALQPVVTAMFANSPFYEGAAGRHVCERAAVWLGMDPDRSGLLPFAWDKSATFRSYIDWALDVPMFLVKRGARILPNTSQTFRQYMKSGLEGERATLTDWETHINSLFPEARLKRTIELRGADAQSLEMSCALSALWKGLLYDARALAEAESLASTLDPVTVQKARPDVAVRALDAELAGKPMKLWAERVVQAAMGGLARIADKDASGRDEQIYLAPLARAVEQGKSPAQLLLDTTRNAPNLRAAVVAATRVA